MDLPVSCYVVFVAVCAVLQVCGFQVDDWENRLNRALDQWLQPLEKAVEKINRYFSSFFEKLGCAGEVHLQRPDNKVRWLQYLKDFSADTEKCPSWEQAASLQQYISVL